MSYQLVLSLKDIDAKFDIVVDVFEVHVLIIRESRVVIAVRVVSVLHLPLHPHLAEYGPIQLEAVDFV